MVNVNGVPVDPSPVQAPPLVAEEEIFKLLKPLTVGTLPGTNSKGVLALIWMALCVAEVP